jgi:ribosome-binding protein aMBF1 (putative translation factor)
MIVCDLCGEAKDCLQKEIDGKEYDVCLTCWEPLASKLKGKGRKIKERETVFLPPSTKESEPEKPSPGGPPKIWSRAM